MTFADTLKEAATSRVALLQEFRVQHNPREERIHAFCEGPEDPILYRRAIRRYAGSRQVFFYTCGGKAKVLEALRDITALVGRYRHTLYFIDKDLSDILGEALPDDDRLYVTDVYSIENYLVQINVVDAVLANYVTVRRCVLDFAVIAKKFETELHEFHNILLTLMAWAICAKRHGQIVNFNNVNLSHVCQFSDDMDIQLCKGGFDVFRNQVGLPGYRVPFRDLLCARREVMRFSAKAVLRGKFELWFFVHFMKQALGHIEQVAIRVGGDIAVAIRIELSNAVAALAQHIDIPESLNVFLRRHLT